MIPRQIRLTLSSALFLCPGVFSWLAAGSENKAFPSHSFTLQDGYELELRRLEYDGFIGMEHFTKTSFTSAFKQVQRLAGVD